MEKRQCIAAIAGFFTLAGLCMASAGEVETRLYAPSGPAAADSRVVTRSLSEGVLSDAGISPLAFSLLPAVSVPPQDWSVAGLRINLFAGRHVDLWGIDAGGLGNELEGTLTGIQAAGIWNRVRGVDAAIQSAGIANLCERDFHGLQTAGVYNWTGEEFTGIQIALVNRSGGLAGLQAGLYNAVDHGNGVQIGLVNVARELRGVQIGLLNVNEESALAFFPVLNIGF